MISIDSVFLIALLLMVAWRVWKLENRVQKLAARVNLLEKPVPGVKLMKGDRPRLSLS